MCRHGNTSFPVILMCMVPVGKGVKAQSSQLLADRFQQNLKIWGTQPHSIWGIYSMKSMGLGERLVSVGPFYFKVFCVLNLDTFSVQFRLLVCTFSALYGAVNYSTCAQHGCCHTSVSVTLLLRCTKIFLKNCQSQSHVWRMLIVFGVG